MDRTDDRREDRALPITGEVGSEGGSYADRTMQGETFSGPAGLPRHGGQGGAASIANYSAGSAGGGSPAHDTTAGGLVRYPTEPPFPASASEGRRVGSTNVNWRAGLIGAAAGFGAALAAGLLREKVRGRR